MRRKIISSLLLMFVMFTLGAGITILYLYKTTSNLQSIINLHRVEIIRQDLVIRAQTVQSHLYSFGTSFGQELDVIVENVIDLDKSSQKCLQCHHTREISQKLEGMVSIVEQYQDALSYLITTLANTERIERLRMVAIGIGTTLLNNVQEMALIAGQKLNEKTFNSLQEINNSKIILIITLVLSFFIAVAISVIMTRQITDPIYALVNATRRIKSGDLGYTAQYKGTGEFRELVDSFNDMSVSLNESNRKVMRHLNNLSNLYSITLSFHSIADETEIYREIAYGVAELVDAEQCGLMLLEGEVFAHKSPAVGLTEREIERLKIPKDTFLMGYYMPSNRRAILVNEDIDATPAWDIDRTLGVRNLLLVWIRQKGKMIGAIRVANKRTGPFNEEDAHPLGILANNISVALDNAKLYSDLRKQMQELKSAQEQLIQAAKLVAIGELASNVAHEINNPLTTVLGYAELMREEKDFAGIMKDVDVIEKETLRAREIVRQLLEFSRKRSLNVRNVDINRIMEEVINLTNIRRERNIEVRVTFGEVPLIQGDENQLKQVFINIINNALFAIDGKGNIDITTRTNGDQVSAEISDTGSGIAREHLSRIFEPFFSTKKEKGTGIGLSVSYKIIQGHNGHIDVLSEQGAGSTFSVVLPIDKPPLS
jgi:signal transduction histidine kinase/HAMP domain-containing protein